MENLRYKENLSKILDKNKIYRKIKIKLPYKNFSFTKISALK